MQTRLSPENTLEIKFDGTDWSDFIPEDKRAYSTQEYNELMTILNIYRGWNNAN